MRASWKWLLLCALPLPTFMACGKSNSDLPFEGDDASTSPEDDSGTGAPSSGSGSGSSGPVGVFQSGDASAVMVAPSDCKAGRYQGTFAGNYASSLVLGIPLTVTGNVDLTLNQAGTADMMCTVRGEGFETCSDVFTLSGGTITGVANQTMVGEAGVGGFPYYCTLTGTLDCPKKLLVNGWIQCTYCVGDLADGGASCAPGLLGPSPGGHFAGPLTATYDTTQHAFTDGGTWNGAESLAGNDGTMPGPDGGSIDDYLALDGGYGFLGKFGGSGTWGATLTP